jgi:hypothetical protein
MGKRTAAELWEQLVDEAGEDLIARAASMSVKDAEKELAAAGVDVAAERAEAERFLEDLASGAFEKRIAEERKAEPTAESPAKAETSGLRERSEAPAPKPAERRENRRRRSSVSWLAIAASFAVGVGGTYAMMGGAGPGVSAPRPPEPPAAAELRRQAAAACDAKRWAECLADLDEARTLDPPGDDEASIKAQRDRAMRGIRGGAGTPAP